MKCCSPIANAELKQRPSSLLRVRKGIFNTAITTLQRAGSILPEHVILTGPSSLVQLGAVSLPA